jgi:hypothetical protein
MSGEASGASVKECIGDVRLSLACQPIAHPLAGSSIWASPDLDLGWAYYVPSEYPWPVVAGSLC